MRTRFRSLALAFLALAFLVLASAAQAQGLDGIPMPALDFSIETMPVQVYAQEQSAWRFNVFHDFKLVDRRPESGITFHQQITDDSGREYKPVHYDHGNGIAAADVDGDGRIDLYFVNQLGDNELWKNLGGGRFQDITAAAGVAVPGPVKVSAAFADIDNDGDEDLFVTTVRGGNHLFTNDGKGHFTDITAAAGLSEVAHSSGVVFFDYDRDGKLDLFVTNVGKYTGEERGAGGYFVGYRDAFSGHLHPERTELSSLYRNLGGGKFAKANDETGLFDGSWSGDATFTDVNEDGLPDLYVLNMQGDDHLWVNVDGRTFAERAERYFPKTSWGAMGVKFFDWDNDGRMDLYTTDMHSDMSREVLPGQEKVKSLITWSDADYLQGGANNIFGNSFYRGLGGGRFEEISDRIGAETYWPWGLSVGDLNADGWQDAFVTGSMNFPFRYSTNSVLLNDLGKTFLDSEFLLGVEPRRELRRPWFEVDCSGADQTRQICYGRTGRQWVYASAGSRSSVIFDLDGDGDLDVVTSEFNDFPQLLVSDLAEKRPIHWLAVRLVGTTSNRDGLGARVQVFAGGRTYTQVHDGKSGYLSQSALPLYFGLGDAEKVERIEVLWPSGRTQTVRKGVEINRTMTITEGS